jgi:RNA-dependent RNA polymerase
MGSLDLEGKDFVLTTTQVSIGGFDTDVKASELVSFLESEIGYVDRCRLKTSCTPLESYPDFTVIDTKKIEKTDDYNKVAPHAFVHFTRPESATEAINAAGCCGLILNKKVLKIISGPQNPNFLNQRRRTEAPFKMSDVIVEIGTLVG